MIAQNVADIVSRHVKLTVEGIDRMYLNVFVPGLQYEQGIVRFFRAHRGQPLPSAALMYYQLGVLEYEALTYSSARRSEG
jgi:hypothetical protein